jgi:hypothetical protein
MLITKMMVLNYLPIAVFFLIAPIGFFLLNSEKVGLWWTILVSAITFSMMVGVLYQALDLARPVLVYSTFDYVMFGFNAFLLWLPIVIVSFVSRKDASP